MTEEDRKLAKKLTLKLQLEKDYECLPKQLQQEIDDAVPPRTAFSSPEDEDAWLEERRKALKALHSGLVTGALLVIMAVLMLLIYGVMYGFKIVLQ